MQLNNQNTPQPVLGAGRSLMLGAGLGMAWGVAMRAWMRYISTEPEFSWAGTLFILGASVIVGSVLGFAHHRRQAGGTGWWRLSILSLALLGAGGASMWPSVILGGIALARRKHLWLRVLLAAGAVAAQVPVVSDVIFDNRGFTATDKAVATAWYAVMLTAEAWAFSVVFMPSMDGVRVPTTLKRVLISASVGVVALAALAAGGMPGS